MREWFERLYQKAIGLTGVVGSDDPERLAREVVRHYDAGSHTEARNLAERLVDIQRERLGEKHPDYATALCNLALILRKLGEVEAASVHLRQALEIRRETLGENHPLHATALYHLADLVQQTGDFTAAETLIRQALNNHKTSLGEHHPDYATGLSGLALLLLRKGELADAEPLLRQALEIRRETLGDHHPDYATSLSNLGLVVHRRGKLADAEPLLRQALEIRRELLGDCHPDYATSLNHLARLLLDKNERDGAEVLARKAVEIHRALLGEEHPEVLSDLQTLDLIRGLKTSATKPEKSPQNTAVVSSPNVPNGRSIPAPIAARTLGAPIPATHARTVPTTPIVSETRPIDETSTPSSGSTSLAVSASTLPPPTPRTTARIQAELESLSQSFAKVGDRLTEAGRRMSELQGCPEARLLEEATECVQRFAIVRTEVVNRARGVLEPEEIGEASGLELADLIGLLKRSEERAAALAHRAEIRAGSLAILDRVLSYQHVVSEQSSLLRPAQQVAEALRHKLERAKLSEPLPSDFSHLVGGKHSLCALVRLVDSNRGMEDALWSDLYRSVAARFGNTLAAASARKRIVARSVVDLSAVSSEPTKSAHEPGCAEAAAPASVRP